MARFFREARQQRKFDEGIKPLPRFGRLGDGDIAVFEGEVVGAFEREYLRQEPAKVLSQVLS